MSRCSGEEERGVRCLDPPLLLVDVLLLLVHGAVAIAAFCQMVRIHLRNPQVGWTRQKVFHILIGCSNIGFIIYFSSAPFATCKEWLCWSHGCGFVLMACPQILLIAAFLLLLSFWVDLCHQASDEDDDEEENSNYEALLEKKIKTEPRPSYIDDRRKCCSFPITHIGSRQKIVAMVALLAFFCMVVFSVTIWIGEGRNPIDSLLMSTIYLDSVSSVVLLLGGALACYGRLLCSKMSTVRSEMVSSEMWKVAGLASVSLVCFSTSAILALVTNVPLQVLNTCLWDERDSIITSTLLFLYYSVGSAVPSAFVLWVMREMPSRLADDRPLQSHVVTFVRDKLSPEQNSQHWTLATTSTNQVNKASPI